MDFVLKKELENSNLIFIDLITTKNPKELKKKLNSGEEFIVARGGSDDINRTTLESKRTDILLGPEFNRERDILRDIMKLLGFNIIHQSVWVGKVKLPKQFIIDLEIMGILKYVEIMEVTKKGSLKNVY